MSDPVLVVGGGLAGLTVAHRLHLAGIAFQLVEARGRLGGRVLSVDATGDVAADGFDLGPSWIWPNTQPRLATLVAELGLATFPQNSEGDIVVHRMSREPPQRYRAPIQDVPHSMRLAGGSGAIIAALSASLPPDSIRLNARVRRIVREGQDLDVCLRIENGAEETLRASHVVLALPPRVLEATVSFSPAVEAATSETWRATPTWMAPHAKVFAIYDRPFWREAGFSGTAQSMAGPLVEIHDATTASGRPALFGFLGMASEQRARVGEAAVVAACVQQLVRLFGPEAGAPSATLFKDWAVDPLTATSEDRFGGHPIAATTPWVDAAWRDRVCLAGSETADVEPGYLAGAVNAGERAAADLIHRMGAAG